MGSTVVMSLYKRGQYRQEDIFVISNLQCTVIKIRIALQRNQRYFVSTFISLASVSSFSSINQLQDRKEDSQFCFYGSVLRWSILITVQRDEKQSSLFIILRVPVYMFRVSTTPIISSTQNCNYSLWYWSYFLCSYLLSTWPNWPRLREVAAQHSITSTEGCSYSFVYSWWWVWLTPETCRVNLQNSK